MGFYNRLRMAAYGAISGWKGGSSDFSNWFGRTFWGIDNSNLANNETIFSIVSRLSNSMATLPIKLYKNFDVVNNRASDVLLSAPNPNMTSFEFIRNLETSRNESGNGYAIIERDIRSQVKSITPVLSSSIEPVIDRETQELWYQVIGEHNMYFFHNLDVIHVKHIVGSGGIKGIDPIKVLKNTSDFDKAIREFSLKEMQNAPNSFIVKYGTNVSLDKKKEIVADFKRFYQENGGILFREPGVEIDELDRKYIAADTFTSERITKARVANVYNTPVIMLNDTEGQSYSSSEQLMRMFVQLTLMPTVRQYEQEFNKKLLTPDERKSGFYYKFNVNALLRGDTSTQGDYYTKALRSGWMTQDEVRALDDLPPKGGNASQLWVSGDLYPIDMDPSERKTTPKKEE